MRKVCCIDESRTHLLKLIQLQLRTSLSPMKKLMDLSYGEVSKSNSVPDDALSGGDEKTYKEQGDNTVLTQATDQLIQVDGATKS